MVPWHFVWRRCDPQTAARPPHVRRHSLPALMQRYSLWHGQKSVRQPTQCPFVCASILPRNAQKYTRFYPRLEKLKWIPRAWWAVRRGDQLASVAAEPSGDVLCRLRWGSPVMHTQLCATSCFAETWDVMMLRVMTARTSGCNRVIPQSLTATAPLSARQTVVSEARFAIFHWYHLYFACVLHH